MNITKMLQLIRSMRFLHNSHLFFLLFVVIYELTNHVTLLVSNNSVDCLKDKCLL